MVRRLLTRRAQVVAFCAVACATAFACATSAPATKGGGNGDDDFGDDPDSSLPPARVPDYSNDDSGAFSPGGRPSSGGTPDSGRSIDIVDAGPGGFSACDGGIEPGDVKIVEIMISSASGADDKGEWIELQSTRTDCILAVNGLTISSPRGTGTDTVMVTDALTVEPGGSFLVADSADSATNHDLPTPLYSWASYDVLKNDGDEIDVKMGSTVIDTLTYPSFSSLQTGSSISFPSDCPWSDRSDWTRWSYSFHVYSGALTGTPNAPNDDVTCF